MANLGDYVSELFHPKFEDGAQVVVDFNYSEKLGYVAGSNSYWEGFGVRRRNYSVLLEPEMDEDSGIVVARGGVTDVCSDKIRLCCILSLRNNFLNKE